MEVPVSYKRKIDSNVRLPMVDDPKHAIEVTGNQTGSVRIPGSAYEMHQNNTKHCSWVQVIFAPMAAPQVCKKCQLMRPDVWKACYEYPIFGSDEKRPQFKR